MTIEEFLMNNETYALSKIDLKLKKYIGYKNGIFLEVGANNGISQSNTYIYEKFVGWKGICIEPSNRFSDLIKNRPNSDCFNVALVSDEWKYPTIRIENGSSHNLTSKTENSFWGFKKMNTLEVKAFKICDIINKTKYRKFDLISIDVEGNELDVIKGFNFELHSTKYFLIEIGILSNIKDKCEEHKNNIISLLDKNGYKIECQISGNDWLFKNINEE